VKDQKKDVKEKLKTFKRQGNDEELLKLLGKRPLAEGVKL